MFRDVDDVNQSAIDLINQEIARLKKNLAPDGAWIETGMVSGREWRQAYWRSDSPIFGGSKRKYIGKVSSPKYYQAIEAVQNRKRLKSLEYQVKILGGL